MSAKERRSVNVILKVDWFDRFLEDFQSFLNVNELIPYLYRAGQLTRDECEWIVDVRVHTSPQQRVKDLISAIKRKGPEAFQNFMAALKESVEENRPCDKGNEYLLNRVMTEAAAMKVPVINWSHAEEKSTTEAKVGNVQPVHKTPGHARITQTSD